CVAERMAVAPPERLHGHPRVVRREVLNVDDTRLEKSRLRHCWILLAYFEYNSMMRCSLTFEGRSARAGKALNVPFRALLSTSSHSGMWRDAAASAAALMRSCSLAFGATSTTSPGRTLYDGMFTRLPLIRMPLWRTTCRASLREAPKPMRYATLSRRVSSNCSRRSPVTPLERDASA